MFAKCQINYSQEQQYLASVNCRIESRNTYVHVSLVGITAIHTVESGNLAREIRGS